MIHNKQIMGVLPRVQPLPGLLVVGEDVTSDQACEIIVRTIELEAGSMDMEWEEIVESAIVGYAPNPDDEMRSTERNREVAKEALGILPLNVLHNHTIMSPFIEGIRGWCHWGGFIGANSFNLGYTVDAQMVLEDWQTIARAFPFLRLRSQILKNHVDEEDNEPLVEFVVKDGTVSVCEPDGFLCEPKGPTMRDERGITERQLMLVLDHVAQSQSSSISSHES